MADLDDDHAYSHEQTAAFQEARKRRIELHDALVRLEQALSSPAHGRLSDWTADVTKALTGLEAAFDEHIDATERPGGLYEEILETSPRLAGQVRRLQDEHPAIRASIGSELERFAAPVGDAEAVEHLRDDVQRTMGQVIRHRQRGADLVWEAYNLDIGGAE